VICEINKERVSSVERLLLIENQSRKELQIPGNISLRQYHVTMSFFDLGRRLLRPRGFNKLQRLNVMRVLPGAAKLCSYLDLRTGAGLGMG